MRITLVRHGETTGQSSIRYYGATDVPLSNTGREQMRRVRDALAGEHFHAVFSSRLSRSRDGAALVCGDAAQVRPLAAFDEVDFGRWEGWTREEIAARDPDAYRLWQGNKGAFDFPGAEPRETFRGRVTAGLHQLLAEFVPGHWLLVVHRGVIGIIIAELLGLSIDERVALGIDLASIHVLCCDNEGWQASALNRTDHLRAE